MVKLLADAKSHFSIGESIMTPERLAEQAAKAGYEAAALCDTMTIAGMPAFTKACDSQGIKPIIGVRLRIVPNLDNVDKVLRFFPKLYILTEEGFRIITQLLSLANDEAHFYRVPRLTWQDVKDALQDAEGHVALSSGSLYSASRDKNVSQHMKEISTLLSRSLTFSEITPGDSAVWDRQSQVGYDLAADLDLPILLSRPAIYDGDDGSAALDLMSSVVNNHKRAYGYKYEPVIKDYAVTQPGHIVRQAVEQSARIKPRGAQVTLLRGYEAGWQALCDAVRFKWSKHDVTLPKMAPDENAELRRLAKEGLKARIRKEVFGFKPSDLKTYVDRLKYELDVLTGMGFAGYFLLTREIVAWSKANGVLVGPGRGSVGGSLVAYVLDITDVDPIRFGLIFERFINPDRLDLPDADLDFMSSRRHEVIDWIKTTYGKDRVAGISNYSTLGSRAALQDLGRIMNVATNEVTKHIPLEGGSAIELERAFNEVPQVAQLAKDEPDLWKTACRLEGLVRSLSVHAAGVVIAGEPLHRRAVVEMRKGDAVVNWDKRVVEDMGLVKMDILGLSTLDMISLACRKIEQRHGRAPDLLHIPLDDKEVLQAFGRGDSVGVFQFESGGMRRLLKDLAGSGNFTFDDISAATALYRPGPMESGLMEDYVNIKRGDVSEHYDHPSMRASLEETYSVIVYQEQVMRIAQDLCGFSMADADKLRKAIGKKDATLMATMGAAFVDGAKAGMIEVETDDGRTVRIHRHASFMCEDGEKRTVEEALSLGLDIEI